jgi:hypothetical protein
MPNNKECHIVPFPGVGLGSQPGVGGLGEEDVGGSGLCLLALCRRHTWEHEKPEASLPRRAGPGKNASAQRGEKSHPSAPLSR